MHLNQNGNIILNKGEKIPFVCPNCKWPIEFDEMINTSFFVQKAVSEGEIIYERGK